LGAGLGDEVGLHRLGVGQGALHDLLALASRLPDQLLVLGEEALRLLVRLLGRADRLVDAFLALLDHGQEGLPAQLGEHEGEDREQHHRPEREAELQVGEAAGGEGGGSQGDHRFAYLMARRMVTIREKNVTPSMRPAATIMAPRMSPAALGWRAMPSMAAAARRPMPAPPPMMVRPAPMPAAKYARALGSVGMSRSPPVASFRWAVVSAPGARSSR